jgi:hypothetical protein
VGVPVLTGLLGLAGQFHITYVTHDQLSIDPGIVIGMAVLGFCPGLILYVIWLVVALALGKGSNS